MEYYSLSITICYVGPYLQHPWLKKKHQQCRGFCCKPNHFLGCHDIYCIYNTHYIALFPADFKLAK